MTSKICNIKVKNICSFLLGFYFLSASIPVFAEAPKNNIARGLIVARIETTLSSEISARIKRLTMKEGDRFKRNQTLVKFDCRLYQAQLNKVKAQLFAAEKTLHANMKLQSYKAISNLEVIVSEAQVTQAKADVALNKIKVDLCEIKAPFNGRVVKLHVAPYASVAPGTPLMDILDDSRLEMQLNIPSRWLSWVRKGTKFNIRIDETGRNYKAKVIRISAKVYPVSQTIAITATIIGKNRSLLAGMSGVAHFKLPSK
jgi:RND family efflux transporter MFP subunit